MRFTWRRALVLLAPALASPFAIHESLNLHPPRDAIPSTVAPKGDQSSAQFKIEHPGFLNENIGNEHLAFNIEVFNSENPCGYGNISLNGLDLPQGHSTSFGDLSTFGNAVVSGITLSDGKTRQVHATWHFGCFAPFQGVGVYSQILNFTIHQIDGKPVANNAGFLLSFRQSPVNELLRFSPVIVSADDKKFNVAEWTQPAASLEELEKPDSTPPSYQEQAEEINKLVELEETLRLKIMEHKKQFEGHMKQGFAAGKEALQSCKDVVNIVVSKVQSAAKTAQSIFHTHLKPELEFNSEQHMPNPPSRFDSIPQYKKKAFLLTILCMSVVLTVLYIGCKCRSNRNKLSRKFQERLARREERRNKKLARRAAFRHHLRTWWQKMTQRRAIVDEEKRVLVTAQEAILEDAMRTEIQQLRMAAQVVESIVSSEQRRSTSDWFMQPRRRQDSLPSYHSGSEDGDVLPPYDDYGDDGGPFCGLVANGFQYARVGPESTPDSSVVDVSPRSSGEFVRRKEYDVHF